MDLKAHIELQHIAHWDEYVEAEEERMKMKRKQERGQFEFLCKLCDCYTKKEVSLELEKPTIDKHLKEVHDILWREYRSTCHKHKMDEQKWGWLEDGTIDLYNSMEYEEGLT